MPSSQRFPKRVKQGHKPFRLRLEKNLAANAGVSGLCGPDTQEILIDEGMGLETEQETVLHELIHGIWNQSGLKELVKEEAQEEIIVRILSPWLLLLLKENPELTEYLLTNA